ncbi:MAG: hypothetical protein HEP70_06285 [Rhodobiaceae bacterium]|nr:hypothetical protein [Rhodobiaceae bacterium]
MTPLPQTDATTVRPFAFSQALVTRIAAALSAYILFILYPAYGLLRAWWMGDLSSFSVSGFLFAVTIAGVFGIFARWTILKYLRIET